MIIRTKVVATVGPASSSPEMLEALARAGVDVFRINFSHGDEQTHEQSLRNIRAVEAKIGEPIAVMGDLCGPKIRVGKIAGEKFTLKAGATLTIQSEPIEGTAGRISTTLAELPAEAAVGQTILINDGAIRLEVVEVRPPREIVCLVKVGGELSSGKGVNLPDTVLSLPAMTEKDRRDAAWIAAREFDYVALSFVRTARDIEGLRDVLNAAGCGAKVVAKIEKPQALENIESIIDAADVVMVARGDLGVEMDLPAVPFAQKRIARLCQERGKCCIIATQMLESMTHSPVPTRAEVSDVANAVLDATDAVMLSGETAVGEYPVAAVEIMNRIGAQAQAYYDRQNPDPHVAYAPARTEASLAAAVHKIVEAEPVAAVAVFTMTGTTARMFAKHRPACPILGLTTDVKTARGMCLYYGVVPVTVAPCHHTREVLAMAADLAVKKGLAKQGDRIVVVSGRPLGAPGNTNTLVIHTIE
ncbi:MAG: pyruvate kinase [Planctomycetota bacterium]|nr:pyruvate kinase [Planctomycetota bacterium]